MECLDANAVQDLMSDALDAGVRAQVMGHLDTCQDCRELVGVLAKETIRESSQPPSGLEATAVPTWAPVSGLERTVAANAETQMSGDALADTVGTDRAPKLAGIAVGRVLGRYTLVERLGAGAMGVVYRGEDHELSRNVAVKILHRPDDALTERLRREARAMAQVTHPNVVTVYDVGTTDATTYIAMELVQGTSLRAWQQTSRTIPEILEVYVAAGRGLAAAHAAGIVHRDFKPDNVLVGNDGRVRVTDFGLAAARPADGESAAPSRPSSPIDDLVLTASGSVLGTPAYMAPEQFEGGNVDARTDQFNFCVALYEALYGERPFAGKSFEDLADKVTSGAIKPPPARSRVSNALRAIVVRGMSVKPGDRFPTMDHLLDELARDRARPWRRASIATAILGAVLAFCVVADWSVRNRLTQKASQSFHATGKQIDRTVQLIDSYNNAAASQAYLFDPMNQLSAYREEEDFGLGKNVDPQQLDEIHQSLTAATWFRNGLPGAPLTDVAIGDYKGRLWYTSAAPTEFPLTDLMQLPWIREALQPDGSALRLIDLADPIIVATRLLGAKPRAGIGFAFARSGRGGTSVFVQIVEAKDVLNFMKLDDTSLAIVAPDGNYEGDVPPELIARTTANDVREITIDTATYQVQAKPIVHDKDVVGRVVMATRIDGVLSLFPHARTAFAAAMLVALLAAAATFLRARHLVQ